MTYRGTAETLSEAIPAALRRESNRHAWGGDSSPLRQSGDKARTVGADLTFATHPPQLPYANVKSKAPQIQKMLVVL
jgi:hypothetical protein